MFGIETFDEYLEWIGDEFSDTHLNYAKAFVAWVEDRTNNEYPLPVRLSNAVLGAINTDLYWIEREGRCLGELERHRSRQERIARKRKETMDRNKEFGFSPPRDSKRKSVYRSEEVLLDRGVVFGSIDEIQEYVDKLVESAWWTRRTTDRQISVRTGYAYKHHAARANGMGSWIQMPEWSWSERVVLHEVAHIMTYRMYGGDLPAHGREFARTLLDLIGHKMGKECADDLKIAFRTNKVKWSLPRKPMTDEQREAASQRLAKARAAKKAL